MLKAISLACLGPAVTNSGIYPYKLIRQEPSPKNGSHVPAGTAPEATIKAEFTPNPQDRVPPTVGTVESHISIKRRGDLEQMEWSHADEKLWHPVFVAKSDAFFFVGYGASRTVERQDKSNSAARESSAFIRAQRVKSLFEEDYPLVPLESWLPQLEKDNKNHYRQVAYLMNQAVGKGHYQFTGRLENGEYLFEQRRLSVPFRALSDGYRAFLGWLGDLLYHICRTCPPDKDLIANRGIVLVDEIDLHIHPKWQMQFLPILARTLPNIQFIVTSHSPLIVGSLEWMNIIVMSRRKGQSSTPVRIHAAVHGLDADQVLLTDFFGLDSTRASSKARRLKKLSLRARTGDSDAAERLLQEMSRGAEIEGD